MRRSPTLLVLAFVLVGALVALAVSWDRSSTGPAAVEVASPAAPPAAPSAAPSPSGPSAAPSSAAGSATGSAATGAAAVTKVLVVVEENHSVAQLRTGMPYLARLGQRYGQALNYKAVRHPSEPNYLVMAGGTTFGVADDRAPAAHPIRSRSVFGQAAAQHLTAATYAQSMRGTCAVTGNVHRGYAVKHNPQAYFVNERALCRRTNRNDATFRADAAANRLPTVGFLIPNRCSDAHDCPLSAANTYLEKMLKPVLASRDFTSGRLAVIITADEDDSRGPNYVYTAVLQSKLHHKTTKAPLSHYSLSKLLSQVSGSTPLRYAAKATDLPTTFGFRLARRS